MLLYFGSSLLLLSAGALGVQQSIDQEVFSMTWIIGGMSTAIVSLAAYIYKLHSESIKMHVKYNDRAEALLKDHAQKQHEMLKENNAVLASHAISMQGFSELIKSVSNK